MSECDQPVFRFAAVNGPTLVFQTHSKPQLRQIHIEGIAMRVGNGFNRHNSNSEVEFKGYNTNEDTFYHTHMVLRCNAGI